MIGVLSLQGNFAMHVACFAKLGVAAVQVRTPDALNDLRGLVIPGGESSVMLKLLASNDLWFKNLNTFFHAKKPIFGTCAGIILLATEVEPVQKSLGFLDISVARNAYGRQIDSHNVLTKLDLNDHIYEVNLPFIRAPKITRVGKRVKPLAYAGGEVVMVEQDHVLGATCHPEATTTLVHEYFVNKCLAV